MKKIFYALLIFSTTFYACQNNNNITTPIVGTSGCNDTIAINYDLSDTINSGCIYGLIGGAWTKDSEQYDIHMTVSSGGILLEDTSWTQMITNPDSMGAYKGKFWDNGIFESWDSYNNMVDSGIWLQIGNNLTIITDTVVVQDIISITQTNGILETNWTESWNDNGEDYVVEIDATQLVTRDPNGFTTNNTNLRKGNNSWINKRKLMNIIKR
jgi:hypothetical protein